MASVTDVVSVTSTSVGEEDHSVETHFDYDNTDANFKLVPKMDALNESVLKSGADEDVPSVIRIPSENETRDDVDGGAIETDKRENNLSNEASDKEKEKSKPERKPHVRVPHIDPSVE